MYKLAVFFEILVLVMSASVGFVKNGVFVLSAVDVALMLLLRLRPGTQVKLLVAEEFEREYDAWATEDDAARVGRVLRRSPFVVPTAV